MKFRYRITVDLSSLDPEDRSQAETAIAIFESLSERGLITLALENPPPRTKKTMADLETRARQDYVMLFHDEMDPDRWYTAAQMKALVRGGQHHYNYVVKELTERGLLSTVPMTRSDGSVSATRVMHRLKRKITQTELDRG